VFLPRNESWGLCLEPLCPLPSCWYRIDHTKLITALLTRCTARLPISARSSNLHHIERANPGNSSTVSRLPSHTIDCLVWLAVSSDAIGTADSNFPLTYPILLATRPFSTQE
jgi:hypothetical protein